MHYMRRLEPCADHISNKLVKKQIATLGDYHFWFYGYSVAYVTIARFPFCLKTGTSTVKGSLPRELFLLLFFTTVMYVHGRIRLIYQKSITEW